MATQNIDPSLSLMLSEYLLSATGFIAGGIFPTIMGSPPEAVELRRYSIKADVTPGEYTDAIFIQQFEEGRTRRAFDGLLLDWEIRVAGMVLDPGNLGVVREATDWSDFSNIDVIDDVWVAIDMVEVATGVRPNQAVFSGPAWRRFRRNTYVIDETPNPHTSAGGQYPSVRQVEELLGVKVLVGNAWANEEGEGGSLNLHQIWGDNVLVYRHVEPRDDNDLSSFGYNFRGVSEGHPEIQVQRLPYDPRRHCLEIEIGYSQAEQIVNRHAACLIRGTTGGIE